MCDYKLIWVEGIQFAFGKHLECDVLFYPHNDDKEDLEDCYLHFGVKGLFGDFIDQVVNSLVRGHNVYIIYDPINKTIKDYGVIENKDFNRDISL